MSWQFILNDQLLNSEVYDGLLLVDYIRKEQRLLGTTVACREGDCGACSVLIGTCFQGKLTYATATSCIIPLVKIQGSHVVTIEGLFDKELTPIQKIFIEYGSTQCGFCTPGFIVALTAYFLQEKEWNFEGAQEAIEGNICRCTGYKSIERSIIRLLEEYSDYPQNLEERVPYLIDKKIIPNYFNSIHSRLKNFENNESVSEGVVVGGGTDLFVQQPGRLLTQKLHCLERNRAIVNECGTIKIQGTTTVEEFRRSSDLATFFPNLFEQIKLFGSTPIRQKATLAGNIVNGSPIGDITSLLLALDATLLLKKETEYRTLSLRKFHLAYKEVDLNEGELIEEITFSLDYEGDLFFNFEKVSKRTFLDIAAVNSSLLLQLEGGRIKGGSLSAGGVAPFPLFLEATSNEMIGNKVCATFVKEVNQWAQKEISPISDVRGSASYKRLLLRQLIYAHFITFFPEQITLESLL